MLLWDTFMILCFFGWGGGGLHRRGVGSKANIFLTWVSNLPTSLLNNPKHQVFRFVTTTQNSNYCTSDTDDKVFFKPDDKHSFNRDLKSVAFC